MAGPLDNPSISAFQKLDPRMQEELYRMKWTKLRQIQVDAIHAIFDETGHLIITANTAGGKTEAAFLPILSRIMEQPYGGVRAVYVGPLKALINDQFRRLEDLCERTEMPVHRWHGDVGQTSKKNLLKDPSGVLLITPESIESLFVNHSQRLSQVFGNLAFIVIDELHSFIGTERGIHLKSLLSRTMGKSRHPVRLVCLSATLGDVELAKSWLFPGNPRLVKHIRAEDTSREIRYLIKGYLLDESAKDGAESAECPDATRFSEDLFKSFYGKTALVFANSRAFLEQSADLARRQCTVRGLPDRFFIHHGSLSKSVREDAEEALKSSVPAVTFCSTTLEMGIDIGKIQEVGQINPPWSVNSLLQRLGRSGRGENDPSIMRHFVLEKSLRDDASLFDRLFPRLLQAVAMTELFLAGWCEPPCIDRIHYSTLVQQVMSMIVERGGATASKLYDTLVSRGAFYEVSQREFSEILQSMGHASLIEQVPGGHLVLGAEGERITRSFEFYSAFLSTDEFRVVNAGHTIGAVSAQSGLEAGQFLILAGRRWKICDVDQQVKEILVEPAKGGRLPCFEGGMGADIHAQVRKMMRDVLFAEKKFSYLDDNAKKLFNSSRSVARESALGQHQFFHDGGQTLWFTWTSSRVNRTLAAMGREYFGFEIDDEGIGLTFNDVSAGEIVEAYSKVLSAPPSAVHLASTLPVKALEKYDTFLSNELQAKVVARNSLDLPGAIEFLKLSCTARHDA